MGRWLRTGQYLVRIKPTTPRNISQPLPGPQDPKIKKIWIPGFPYIPYGIPDEALAIFMRSTHPPVLRPTNPMVEFSQLTG